VFNATRACEMLVGLPAVNVLEVDEPFVGRLVVTVESRARDAGMCGLRGAGVGQGPAGGRAG
jgi:hypothetical protein